LIIRIGNLNDIADLVVLIFRCLDGNIGGSIVGVVGVDLIQLIEAVIDVFGSLIQGGAAEILNDLSGIAKSIVEALGNDPIRCNFPIDSVQTIVEIGVSDVGSFLGPVPVHIQNLLINPPKIVVLKERGDDKEGVLRVFFIPLDQFRSFHLGRVGGRIDDDLLIAGWVNSANLPADGIVVIGRYCFRGSLPIIHRLLIEQSCLGIVGIIRNQIIAFQRVFSTVRMPHDDRSLDVTQIIIDSAYLFDGEIICSIIRRFIAVIDSLFYDLIEAVVEINNIMPFRICGLFCPACRIKGITGDIGIGITGIIGVNNRFR